MDGAANVVSTALANVSTVFDSAVTMVTNQPLAMVFIGFTIVASGIALFRNVIGH